MYKGVCLSRTLLMFKILNSETLPFLNRYLGLKRSYFLMDFSGWMAHGRLTLSTSRAELVFSSSAILAWWRPQLHLAAQAPNLGVTLNPSLSSASTKKALKLVNLHLQFLSTLFTSFHFYFKHLSSALHHISPELQPWFICQGALLDYKRLGDVVLSTELSSISDPRLLISKWSLILSSCLQALEEANGKPK